MKRNKLCLPALMLAIFINCIHTAHAINYYIDNINGNDNNSGISPAAAWQSLTNVNTHTFAPGDSILFARGGYWRGQITPQSGVSSAYITYAAYGTGAKPLILGSKNKSNTTDWTSAGGNIWQSTDTSGLDVGNIIFNNEAAVGVKKWTASALTNQGDFWWDKTGTHTVKMYSVSNPASFYSNIELAIGRFIVYAQLDSYFVFQNMAFKYGAADGIEIRNTHHAIIRDCDVSYIGGTELTTQVRYGGGIQFWAYSNNNTIERCRFWEIYDDAVTNQCTPSNAGPAQQYDLFYRNNLIRNCSESSFCCDLRPATLAGSFLKNIYFENNTCINAGGGWAAAQRPDLKGFQIYFSAITAPTDSIFIRNNVFYGSRAVLFVDNSSVHTLSYTTMDYNCWHPSHTYDTIAALWSSTSFSLWTASQFAAYQSTNAQDQHSIFTDPLLLDPINNDFHLSASSPCIDAGTNTGIITDIDLNARPQGSAYDMGAYEYIPVNGIQNPDADAGTITLYPNPCKGIFSLRGLTAGTEISISDMTGEMVYCITAENDQQTIDISFLAEGEYLVRALNSSGKISQSKLLLSK